MKPKDTTRITYKNYFIDIDSQGNHATYHEKEGQPTPRLLGYFSTLRNSLHAIVECESQVDDEITIGQYVKLQKEMWEDIKNTLDYEEVT